MTVSAGPAATAYAQAPGNDSFATPLELTDQLTGSSEGATAEPGEPEHYGRARASVWFTYTADADRLVTVDSCGSGFDTVLAVYEGDSLSTLYRRDNNDDACDVGSRVSFYADRGSTYRLALDGFRGETGDYSLSLDAPLANDDRDEPWSIWDDSPATGDSTGATREPGEPDHAGSPAAHSLWYETWLDAGTPVVLESCGSSFATRLAVYAWDDPGTVIAESAQQSCGDGRLGTVLRFTADPDAQDGVHLRIALDGVDGAEGAFRLAMTTGDDRAHPYWLWHGSRVALSNVGATHEPGEPAHAGDPGGGSLWFALSTEFAGREFVVDTCDTPLGGLDTLLAAYVENAGELTPIAMSDDEIGCAAGTGSRISFVVPEGDVRIAVDGKAGATGEFVLSTAAAPLNDDRVQAELLPDDVDYWWGDTTLATSEADEPAHGGSPAAHSVWYRWQPETSGPVEAEVCGSGAVVAVYTADLDPLGSASSGPDCSPGVRFDAVAGTDYLIAVDGTNVGFELALSRPPANDDAADALQIYGGTADTTRGATRETDEHDHAGVPAARSLWYRYETPAWIGAFSVSLCPHEDTPAQVAVYRGTGIADLVPVDSASRAGECARVRVPVGEGAERAFLVAVDTERPVNFTLNVGDASAPRNDDRADAYQLYGADWGSTASASHEAGEPDHAGAGGSTSVWYRWTPEQSGPAQVDVCDPGSDYGPDAVVAVYDDALATVGTRSSECGEARHVDLDAEAGRTYWIAVDTRPGGEPEYQLSAALRPENDDRADALAITETAHDGEADLATREPGEPEHAGVPDAPSLWYRWTPDARGPVTIDTCASGYKVDSLLAVYVADTVEPVAESDDAESCGYRGARITFQPVPGVEYLIAVAARPGRTGQVTLSMPPVNDHLDGAVPQDGESFGEDVDLSRAGAETGEPAHDGAPARHSVWYAWTPPRSGLATIEACGQGARTGVYVGATVEALTPVAGTASDCEGGRGLRFEAQAGTTYRVAIDGDSRVWLGANLAPENDRFAAAYDLGRFSRMSTEGNTYYAGREPDEPDHAGAGGTSSLWYTFTAAATGNATVETCTLAWFDTAVAVYRQTGTGVAGLEAAGESDDSEDCGDGKASRAQLDVTAGVRYYVAVDGHAGATGRFRLEIIHGPSNDALASAASLTPGTRSGTLLNADREAGEPDHGYPDASRTVWYRWVPPHTAMARIDVCPPEGVQSTSRVTVYRQDGTAFGDLVRVGDTSDASCGPGRRVRWRAQANTQYRIVVSGADSKDFTLRLAHGPHNDDLANAFPIGHSRFISTDEATRETGEPEHGGPGGASVWWSYTATRTGPTVVSTCGSDYDTLLAVYEQAASLEELDQLAAADDGEQCAPGTSRLTADLTEGETYLIAVDGKDGATGNLSLAVDPPANDRFSDAATLTGLPAYAAGSTHGARREPGEPYTYRPSTVWWRWTAPETRTVEVSSCGNDVRADVNVYEGTELATLQPRGTVSGECHSDGQRVTLDATAGTTYHFQVQGDEGEVQIHVDAPANDEWDAASTLTLGPDDTVEREGTLAGAGHDPDEESHGGVAPTRSVWFAWTAPSGAPVEVSTCGSEKATVLHPYAYVPAFPWSQWRTQGTTLAPCEGGQRHTFTAVAGRQYRFAVVAAEAEAGAYRFRISQAQDTVPPRSRITAGPSYTGAQLVQIHFEADEQATFECALDGATPTACTSPLELADLPEGDHIVSVRATDLAGNREAQPSTHVFRIDRTPPQTTLTGAADGAPVHGLPQWQLFADEPVSRFECSLDGAPVNCGSIDVSELSLGTHALRAWAVDRAGNPDSTPVQDTFELVDEPPAVDLTLDDPAGPATHEVALGIPAADPEGDPMKYTVDWGDGKPGASGNLPTSSLTHAYTRAGVYTISVEVKDPWRTTVASRTVEVAPGEPLDARAGDDIVAVQDEPVVLDGGDSRPLKGIEDYKWSFGDGSPAKHGRQVTHSYTAGTHTATLEVTLDGAVRTDQVEVIVKDPPPGGLVLRTTKPGNAPLEGVDLQLVDSDGRRHSTVSDHRGEARLRGLPDGEYTIFADRDGYKPVVAQATVAGGDGEKTIELTPGVVAVAELTSRPLTVEEAVARGVDQNDASSYTTYDFTARIVLVDNQSVPIRGTINNGFIYSGNIDDGACNLHRCVSQGGSVVTTAAVVDGRPIITTMVVPMGAGSFMKEFFDVSMTVSNLAPAGFTLRAGRTALELPSGLSLAPTNVAQSASVDVADIPGGTSRTTSWTVRGDTAGSYDLAASYTGRLDPSGRPVTIRAETGQPLKVWGATAVEPVVEVDDEAGADHPFTMRVGVRNVASVPVYNATVDLRTDGSAHYLEQPAQKRQFTFAYVPAGTTAWSDEIILVPDAGGEVDVTRSVVRKVAGDSATATAITTHARQPKLDDDPVLVATPMQNRIELDWDPVEGAKGYRIYRTSTDRETPFSSAPIAATASSKATIRVPASEPTQLYAVSAMLNGRPTLRHPVVEAASTTEDPDDDDGSEDPNGPPDAFCEDSTLEVGPVTLTSGCFVEVEDGVWESEVGALGRVRAGGVDITPTGEAKVRIDVPNLTLSVADAKVEAGDWVLYQGTISWSLGTEILIDLSGGATFKGLGVSGQVEISFDGEKAKLSATAALPMQFGGVTGLLELEATTQDGLVLGTIAMAAPEAPVGKLGLKGIALNYAKVDGKHRWAGTAGVMLPARGFAESLSGTMSILDGSFESASVELQGINKPLGTTGMFLQRIRIAITIQPDFKVGGGLGVSVGPRLFGHEAISVDGDVEISFGDPVTWSLTGRMNIVEAELATAYLKYAMPASVDVGGSVSFVKSVAGKNLGITARIDGWVAGTEAFNVEGSGTIFGPGFEEGGDAVFSSVGVAACRHGWGPDIGAGYKWDREPKWFAGSCGIGDYRAERPGAGVRGKAAVARSLQVAPATAVAVFAVQGDSAPPKITLTGPAGETVATPAGPEAVSTPRFLLMQEPGTRTTHVAVERPSAGVWEIRTLPGSAAVTDVRQADSLPAVSVGAEIRGTGANRELAWALRDIAGQEVTFVAEGGGTRQVIATTADASGTAAFSPDPGLGGRRVVRAFVTQDGLVRATVEVASFVVEDELLSPPSQLALERQGDDVAGTWAASLGATGYRATVDVGDGRRLSFDLGVDDRSVTVPGVADGETVTLEVAARTPAGSLGPSAIVQLDAGAAPTAGIEPPDRVLTGESVTLTAAADPSTTIEWELDGDGAYDDAGGASVSHAYSRPGLHPVAVRVTDAAGRMATAAQTVVVDSRAPHAAIAAAGTAPLAGETVSFTGTDSDPDGAVLSRAWDLDGDGAFDDAQGAAASRIYGAGAHTIRYRVVDDSGEEATAERTIQVTANQAPEITMAIDTAAPVAGETVRLTASASDPEDRGLEAIAWDLDGDGRFADAAGAEVAHLFAAGTVTIRARVSDTGGATTTIEQVLSVRPATEPSPPSGGSEPPPATPQPPLGALSAPKSARRATLLKRGIRITFRDVRAGTRLKATLRFVPRRGRAVRVGRLRTTARSTGKLVRRLRVTRAGRRALRRRARGRLQVVVVARSGAEAPVKLTRRIRYRP